MALRLSSTVRLRMGSWPIFQLGLAFLLVFTAFNSAGYIQVRLLLPGFLPPPIDQCTD